MDDAEVTDLYRQWGAALYRRCLKLLGDDAAAQDATQEVFLRLIRQADRLVPGDGYLGWIYRVATNHCLNRLRDDRRLALFDPDNLPVLGTDGAASSLPDRDLSVRILRRFDDETQTIAVLSLCDGLSRDEVADVLGISRKTVGRKLERFLTDARKYLSRASA